ncbi:MAG: lamin tail domain-containing protein [Bacteroidota bacterium]
MPAEKAPELVTIDVANMASWLKNAPMEDTPQAKSTLIVVDLPLPGGRTIEVLAEEAPVLKGKVAAQYPNIKTYSVRGVENPTVAGKLTVTPYGISALLDMGKEQLFIDPSVSGIKGIQEHAVYYGKDGSRFVHGGPDDLHANHDSFLHSHGDGSLHSHGDLDKLAGTQIGNMERVEYNLLVVANDGYYAERGNTNAAVTAAITMDINDVNVLYERDFAIRLILSPAPILFNSNPTVGGATLFNGVGGDANEGLTVFDQLVTSNPADPSDNTTVDANVVAASNGTVTAAGVGVNTFDVGHIFKGEVGGCASPSGGGGSGYVGVTCFNGSINSIGDPGKAGGGSGVSCPTGSGWVNLVAHELGHQFGGQHTWNAGTAPCGTSMNGGGAAGFCDAFGQYDSRFAFEPGSGVTLLSYATICDQHDMVEYGTTTSASSIPYAHSKSIEQIRAHVDGAGASCRDVIATTNNAPMAMPTACSGGFVIPNGTPFELVGIAMDADGDALTYSWEQIDLGAQGPPGVGAAAATAGVGEMDVFCDFSMMPPVPSTIPTGIANAGAPTFRSYVPSSSPIRVFPRIEKILAGVPLSNSADRDGEVLPNFARAMNFRLTVRDNNGGIGYSDVSLNTDANGPFMVTSPTTSTMVDLNNSTTLNVTWSTGGFTGCTNVNVKLSLDGGRSFPITLGTAAYSALSTTVNIPASTAAAKDARVRVECGDGGCATFFQLSEKFEIMSSCAAVPAVISPDATCTFDAGDAGLNLSLSNNLGTAVSSFTGTLASTDTPSLLTGDNGGTCGRVGNPVVVDAYTFQVDMTGSYTISLPSGSPLGQNLNIYQNTYNPDASCANWLAGTYDVSSNGLFPTSITINLTACQDYVVVVGTFDSSNGLGAYTINIAAPAGANAYNGTVPPSSGFSYTYVAVNDATGNIDAESANSDFSTLGGGCYTVYGISYSNADGAPTTGSSFAALSSTDCRAASTNSKTLKVNATCNVMPGQLVITEIMYNPASSEPAGEWFEVYNPTGAPIDMNGLEICENGGTHTISSSVVVPAMGYAVLGSNANTAMNGGANVNYAYGGSWQLNNTGDVITVKCSDGTVIDQVDYSTITNSGDGKSIQLRPRFVKATGATDNDTPTNWYVSDASNTSMYGSGGLGTPNTQNVPVELLYFTASETGTHVVLDWATASELNNDHFLVQRSTDGRKFITIGKVKGAGTTIVTQYYQLEDIAPAQGLNYYRLKQIDTDGTFEYSEVVSVHLQKDELIAKVYPSPTSDVLNVEVNQAVNGLEIVDLTGRVLLSNVYEGIEAVQLEVHTLPMGTYFVNIQLEQTIKTMRFVKN